MTISLVLQPEIERDLLAQAQAKGVSLTEYVQQIVARAVKPVDTSSGRMGQELIDIGARVRGLLSDEEVDTLFHRVTPTFSEHHNSYPPPPLRLV
jgi:hypothetical protein